MIVFSEMQHYSVPIFLICALAEAQCERGAGGYNAALGAEDNTGHHHHRGTADAKIRMHAGCSEGWMCARGSRGKGRR